MDIVSNKNKIEWKKIDLSDREIFEDIGENKEGIAMFSFASMFFWKDHYNTSYAVLNNNIVAKGTSDNGEDVIYFPRGIENNIKETIDTIIEGCEKMPALLPLTKETAEKIAELFDNASVSVVDGKSEYVYNQEDLANLAGKKYHAKRNHIAKFDKLYNCEYINISEENIGLLKECAEYMFATIENSPKEEFTAINCAIDNFAELGLRACVIMVDGKFAAYSIGSSVNEEVADIHFEKADRGFEGSYAKVNNCFAKYGFADKKYMNREEDLGIEGLRKAKLSYRPVKLGIIYNAQMR